MEKYSLLLTEIKEFMKLKGFKKNKESFFLYSDNNIGLIEFQKNNNRNKFTINVGVYSTSLKVFDNFEVNLKPAISDCHWKIRIGFLMSTNEDLWWELNENTSVSDLLNDVTNALNEFAIPHILNHISDEKLEKKWILGISEGISEQQMLLYLITLLKNYNKMELNSKIHELKAFSKGKPFYQNIKESLEKIGISYE